MRNGTVRLSSDDPTDPWFLVRRPYRQQLGALALGTASGDASLVSGKAIFKKLPKNSAWTNNSSQLRNRTKLCPVVLSD